VPMRSNGQYFGICGCIGFPCRRCL